MLGLNKWYVHLFEKLGWMVLSASKLDRHPEVRMKIVAYENSIRSLIEHIEARIQMVEAEAPNEVLELHDLRQMLIDSRVLHQHVRMDFENILNVRDNRVGRDNRLAERDNRTVGRDNRDNRLAERDNRDNRNANIDNRMIGGLRKKSSKKTSQKVSQTTRDYR